MANPPTNVSVAATAPGTNEITPQIEDNIIAGAVATETSRAVATEGSLSNSLVALTGTVTSQGSAISTNSTTLGSLQASLTTLTGTITSQGSTLVSNGSAVTAVQASVTTLTATVSTQGSTLASTGSAVSTVQTSLTSLTGTVASQGSFITTNGSAIGSLQATIATTEKTANKGIASGYAALDATAKIPLVQLPASVIGSNHYIGMWNASTNSPTLTSGTSTAGAGGYYVVSTAGSTTLDGLNVWGVGDWVIFNGTVWQKLDGQANPVSSVAGRQGSVILAVTDVSGALASNSGTATSLLLSADPAVALGAATKQYVDAKVVSAPYVRSTYTASGTLATTDNLSLVTSSTAVTMTLANGTVDNHPQLIKQFGPGSVSVSGTFDGTMQTITLSTLVPSSSNSGSLYSSVTTRWIAASNTYIVE